MDIKIHYQNVNFRLPGSTEVKKWIESAICSEGKFPGRIDYYFIDDESQRDINSEFLEHHYNTDVITFDYTESNIVSGEIYIAIETVRRNSKELKNRLREEYLRVMIHGVLHLLGYNDKTDEEVNEMRQKEDLYLKSFGDGRA